MKQVLLDVVEWQAAFDFGTGKEAKKEGPLLKLAEEVLKKHRYPGDTNLQSIPWVTDVALELYNSYRPGFMFLNFAQPYLMSAFVEDNPQQWKSLMAMIFAQIERFAGATGMTPVVVGTGDMIPLKGYIDLSALDGFACGGGMAPRYAGLFKPSAGDMNYVLKHRDIELVVEKEKLIALFGNVQEFIERLPDFILVAKEGFIFKTFGSAPRPFYKVQARNKSIPVYSTLGNVSSITDICSLVLTHLQDKKIALIIVEGIGTKNFPGPCVPCSNSLDWYTYAPGEGQYLSITTGKHLAGHSYPPGFKYYLEDTEEKKYPLSGYFGRHLPITIGHRFRGKSAAVGTRSILTHMAGGADISIECFARGLYNYGTMAVIKPGDG